MRTGEDRRGGDAADRGVRVRADDRPRSRARHLPPAPPRCRRAGCGRRCCGWRAAAPSAHRPARRGPPRRATSIRAAALIVAAISDRPGRFTSRRTPSHRIAAMPRARPGSTRRSAPPPMRRRATSAPPVGRRGVRPRRPACGRRRRRRSGARSTLLITSTSAIATPGPPLRGTSSPPAVSSTKIWASTRPVLNTAVRLSPPDSTSVTSTVEPDASRRISSSSMASRFAAMSSRIAVCGQQPVSTATIRSSASTPARRSAWASSVVKMSLVTTASESSSRSS